MLFLEMETLRIGALPVSNAYSSIRPSLKLLSPNHSHILFATKSINSLKVQKRRNKNQRRAVQKPRMDMATQMKEMAAAQKRWQNQIKEGKVKALTPKEAGYAMQLSNKILLDVRPSSEHKKAWVKGSHWTPIFDVDRKLDPGTVSKKLSNFLFGGWWSGIPVMAYNSQFMKQVQDKFSKDSDIIVVCQKGIRSLAACEQLYNDGYTNLYWVDGGFDSAEEGDFEREGPQPLKFAGIGGLSEFIGWTDQQRSAGEKEGLRYRAVYFGRLLAIALLADALFIAAQKLAERMHETTL